ncbi:MAG TPA: hypothetical protein VIJ31_16335 [Acidothermaceae bacterium]
MTDDMEERLRAALRDRAGVPVAAGDPVVAVQDRMRRRSRRRGIAVGSSAAVCVAGIAIAATALAGNDTSSGPIGPAVTSSNPATAAATAAPTTTPPTSPAASSTVASPSPTSIASAVVAPSSIPPSTTLPPNVSRVALPSTYTFFGLSTDSGSMLLTGAVTSTDPNVPCIRTPTDAATLTLGAVTTGSCADPELSGERVAIDVINPDGGSLAFTTSIAITVTDPKTGTPKTGPVVMRISEASDTYPVVAYGGGSMWVYDVDTSNGPEAIQVSTTTGKVEDVVRTPQLYRPIMAANGDGLWLGNSIEGSPVAGTVFHVVPGSHVVTTVVPSPSDAVDWLVADAGHVWAGIRPNSSGTQLSLWRFDGPTARVAFHTPEPTLQAGTNSVVGDEHDGLWLTTPDPPFGDFLSPADNQHLDVVKLDADTGKPTVEAVLPPLDQLAAEMQTASGQAAFSQGSYFLLQSPSVGGYTGFTQLLRVMPLP